jgi:diguanylate cyclase (GGDEF)-like protein
MLDAVVQIAGRNLGLLCLEHVGPAHHWSADEIAFACQLADKLAVALANRGRRQAEARLEHQANYDALTELPNRTLFYDRLAQTLSQARRHGWHVGVLFVDVDRFKNVNDTLGHATGDRLLREAGARLSACVRAGDTVARIGGDEFALIAADLAQPQDAGVVAGKMLEALARPFVIDGQEIFLSGSVGIAAYPVDGADAVALMKNADVAMSRAKELGRNNYQFYAAPMNARAMEELLLLNDLRRALERGEFRLHFQPKASLKSGRACGFEALLRWERPGHGLVPPGKFIPLLEESGLIVPVGEWVIRAACAQLRDWRAAGLEPLPVAVNLAAKQFAQRDIVAVVDAALVEHGVPPHLLEIEITESDAMQDAERVLATLGELSARGVGIAIDDFGTGYSSLAYLKRFPVETLKLDRSFVNGLPGDANDVSIALAVITMAHSLGFKVVAEGVEKAAQRDFLAQHGCDQMQGYLFARPMPAGECARLLGVAPLRAVAGAD